MPQGEAIHVLFVCTGNICRSPMAEGIFRHILIAQKVSHRFVVDSAATIGDHAGNPPHAKAQAAMRARGIDISQLRSRKLTPEDLRKFDWIVVLDRGNLRYVRSLADESSRANVALLMDFTENWAEQDVPDPLLSPISFNVVTKMIEDACFDLFYELEASIPTRNS
jgi:protein-tyrosine phosphatase